jgi:hypothetical protein
MLVTKNYYVAERPETTRGPSLNPAHWDCEALTRRIQDTSWCDYSQRSVETDRCLFLLTMAMVRQRGWSPGQVLDNFQKELPGFFGVTRLSQIVEDATHVKPGFKRTVVAPPKCPEPTKLCDDLPWAEAECRAASGVLRPSQRCWQQFYTSWLGGPFFAAEVNDYLVVADSDWLWANRRRGFSVIPQIVCGPYSYPGPPSGLLKPSARALRFMSPPRNLIFKMYDKTRPRSESLSLIRDFAKRFDIQLQFVGLDAQAEWLWCGFFIAHTQWLGADYSFKPEGNAFGFFTDQEYGFWDRPIPAPGSAAMPTLLYVDPELVGQRRPGSTS